jgi:uncharacterized protein YukE
MARILVDPVQLRAVANHFYHASNDMDGQLGILRRKWSHLSYQAAEMRARIRLEALYQKAHTNGTLLQAESQRLARQLETIARIFEAADRESSTRFSDRMKSLMLSSFDRAFFASVPSFYMAWEIIDLRLLAEKLWEARDVPFVFLSSSPRQAVEGVGWALPLIDEVGILNKSAGKYLPIIGAAISYGLDNDPDRVRAAETAIVESLMDFEPHIATTMLVNGVVQLLGMRLEKQSLLMGAFMGGEWKEIFLKQAESIGKNFDRIDLGPIHHDLAHIFVDGAPLVQPYFKYLPQGQQINKMVGLTSDVVEWTGVDLPGGLNERLEDLQDWMGTPMDPGMVLGEFIGKLDEGLASGQITSTDELVKYGAESGLDLFVDSETRNQVWNAEVENFSDLWEHMADFRRGLITTIVDVQSSVKLTGLAAFDWGVSVTKLPPEWKTPVHNFTMDLAWIQESMDGHVDQLIPGGS